MLKLSPIETPNAAINLFRDGDGSLWIQQNNLTVALGYNKFLSRNSKRGSGIGKFFHGDAIQKLGNLNLINLQMLVDNIFPQFLADFFRNINSGGDTARVFFKTEPNTIYHNALAVFKILQEVLFVAYDENSAKAKLGNKAEEIFSVQMNNNQLRTEKVKDWEKSDAGVVDFKVFDCLNKFLYFAEVKAQKAFPFGITNEPTFSLPRSRIEAYLKYAKEKKATTYLYVLDTASGVFYGDDLSELMKVDHYGSDGSEFPQTKYHNTLKCDWIYFHQRQFIEHFSITPADFKVIKGLQANVDREKTSAEPINETAKGNEPLLSKNVNITPLENISLNNTPCAINKTESGQLTILLRAATRALGYKGGTDPYKGGGAVPVAIKELNYPLMRDQFNSWQMDFELFAFHFLPIFRQLLDVQHSSKKSLNEVLKKNYPHVLGQAQKEYARLTAAQNKRGKSQREQSTAEGDLFKDAVQRPVPASPVQPATPQKITTINDFSDQVIFNQFIHRFGVDEDALLKLMRVAHKERLELDIDLQLDRFIAEFKAHRSKFEK